MKEFMTIEEIDAEVAALKTDALHKSAIANHSVCKEEVAAFCTLLNDLPSVDLDELMALFEPLALPAGYDHVSAIDVANGEEIGGLCLLEGGRPITLHDVFWTVTDIYDEEIVEWTSTEVLPSIQPGLLSLGVTIERRPRTSRPARLGRPQAGPTTQSTESNLRSNNS